MTAPAGGDAAADWLKESAPLLSLSLVRARVRGDEAKTARLLARYSGAALEVGCDPAHAYVVALHLTSMYAAGLALGAVAGDVAQADKLLAEQLEAELIGHLDPDSEEPS